MHNYQMNVLVVGGAGYVGGALTDLLAESEHNVRVYDALLYEECYRKPVDFVFGDIRDREALIEQLRWADVVVWLAALVGDAACALHPEVSRCINQGMVRWMSESFDGRILFLSTCSVYGAQNGLLYETSRTAPLSVYAETKLEAETYLADKDAIVDLFDAMKPGVRVQPVESRDLNILAPADGAYFFPEDRLQTRVSTPGRPPGIRVKSPCQVSFWARVKGQ